MGSSLRDQLVQAGLASKDDARKASRQQGKQARQKPRGQDDRERAARQAQAAKAARDRELEDKRKAKAERKARQAEIRQLIERNALPPLQSDERFHFVDGGRVRRVVVDAERRRQVIAGELRIVRGGARYALVAPDVAARIGERDPSAVITLDLPQADAAHEEDDPYKDYVVPDDLIW